MTPKPWYDAREGIEGALKSGLAGLKDLSQSRDAAAYGRRERLSWWLVLSHFVFDECGNTMVITENPPDYYTWGNEYPPKIATKAEWKATDQQRPMSYTMGCIPPHDEVCPRCLEGWTLQNIDNHLTKSYRREDTTPEDEESGRVWGWTSYHKDCYKLKTAEESREFFVEMIGDAGFDCAKMYAIPNGYSRGYASAWWIVETDCGPVKIGGRKRVFSISWDHAEGLKDVDGREIFEDQQVTKDRHLVHAWGRDKAIEYLQKIVGAGVPAG